ncbi:MAG: MBL fold metallo-hydrolase [Dehalococcoidia bacterium]
MLLKQYYLGCLAHASYLIADDETRTAAVVDPQRDVDQYLAEAEAQGLAIRYVFLTHFHADFVAGHLELRERAGAKICLSARGQADYDFTPFEDGAILEFGKVRLQVLETPGHTPESISILIYDLEKDGQVPHAVLTGDALFIGDVGRPDMLGAFGWSATTLAGMLYDSLHDKLLTLPDETLVYPAHGAGTLCGRNLSTETVSTIGEERRYNYALQPMSKEEFIPLVTAGQPEAPAYFGYDVQFNRSEHPTLDETLDRVLKPLSLDQLLRLRNTGAQVLDARDQAAFAGAHLSGALNVPLGGEYASWCGALLSQERPIVIVAEPGREKEASMRLGRIGFDHVAGYLEGGMQALAARPDLAEGLDRFTAVALAEQLQAPQPPFVLDVRRQPEWQDGHIENSVHIPLHELSERLDELPRDRQIVLYCTSGYRSAIAASLLQQRGLTDVADLVGGVEAWKQRRGGP